jgi:hypothetical protein
MRTGVFQRRPLIDGVVCSAYQQKKKAGMREGEKSQQCGMMCVFLFCIYWVKDGNDRAAKGKARPGKGRNTRHMSCNQVF